MKLLYITNSRIPTEKAHGINIVETCNAFSKANIEIILVLPKRHNIIKKDTFSYYGIGKTFKIKYLRVFDFVRYGFLGFWVTQISFIIALLFQRWNKKEYIIFTRDEWTGWILALCGYKVFYDMHGFPVKWLNLWQRSMKRMTGIICTNKWKMEQCNKFFNINSNDMVIARNGFNSILFDIPLEKKEARKKLQLPQDKKIIMYTGHLYDWKGVDIVAQVASLAKDWLFIFVGGSKEEVEKFAEKYYLCNNILILGQKLHKSIPLYLWAADVLVLPNSRRSISSRLEVYSQYDTSPIKMFEYMASNRPIVASRLSSICEVLNEDNSVLVDADNLNELFSGLQKIIGDEKFAKKIANQALDDVRQYAWDKRALKIINFINKKNI
jgi:glycosyltransferase involved in cell wall biosynthesis